MTPQDRTTTPPGPMLRRGPRPLAMHLARAMPPLAKTGSMPSSPGSTGSSAASMRWPAAAAAPDAPHTGPGAGQAEAPPAPAPDAALIAGIAAYRRHPYRRDLPEPPVLYRAGELQVLDYRPEGGMPLLFVPSLINRAYVLDLAEGRSMLRWLSAAGFRPLLLDWGWPGPDERRLDLSGYVTERLEPALETVSAEVGGPVHLSGYCMGGLLALAAAQRRPELCASLSLLAVPWDFHAPDVSQAAPAMQLAAAAARMMAMTGALPVDAIQAAFAAVDPEAILTKFRAFGRSDQESESAHLFVALEDWLNDGIPLSGPVAQECLAGWYGMNTPARGMWHVAGRPIRPAAIGLPALAAIPRRDRIVPPESASALAAALPRAEVLDVAAGHIGMVAGPRAEQVLWRPFADWLHRQPR